MRIYTTSTIAIEPFSQCLGGIGHTPSVKSTIGLVGKLLELLVEGAIFFIPVKEVADYAISPYAQVCLVNCCHIASKGKD